MAVDEKGWRTQDCGGRSAWGMPLSINGVQGSAIEMTGAA
jgi:hypothetical protein